MMTEETIQLLAWLGIAVFLGILEAVTVALISLWFAIGALAAMIPAYFARALWVQILVFLVVSAVCLAFTRTFFKDVVKTKKQPTNSDRLIGSDGVVSSKIDNLQGPEKSISPA
jgi:membrane protein implicated in regulation of membrane protease activity